MKTYRAIFFGRTRGAIGIFHWCEVIVQAEDTEQARLKLYDTHDLYTSDVRFEELPGEFGLIPAEHLTGGGGQP